MKRYFTLLVTLFLTISVCAQSSNGAYRVKSLEGEAFLVKNRANKALSIGDLVNLSDTIKLQSGSKMTILQLDRPNKIFQYADNRPSTIYHIVQTAGESGSIFRELLKTIVRHNKKDNKARLSRPSQVSRGIGKEHEDVDKYVYSKVVATIKEVVASQTSKGHSDVEIVRQWSENREFSFKLRKNSSEDKYINVVYFDADGKNFGFCFDENLLIDGKLKKEIALPIAFDASRGNLIFMVIASSYKFDVAVVQQYIRKGETPMVFPAGQEDPYLMINLER